MTVFEKLNEARLRFQNAGIQKSGQNKFAGYSYYELADILPVINKLANELKFCCVINYKEDLATLDFCDIEKDERITFSCPMCKTTVKGATEVQCEGAVITYLKRYLYQNCFEIVEADMLDSTLNPNESNSADSEVDSLIAQVKSKMNTMSDEQLDFTNKAIAGRDIGKLKAILSKMAK
jgi:hypothetical protein